MRRRPVTEVFRYRARSALRYRLDLELSAQERNSALALPPGFNPRSLAIGRQWRHDLREDNAVVSAALDLFHASFYYTLSAPVLGRDSIDDFLFSSKRGFCEHYAAAFVVLMRAAGIPSRVVTGYQGGYFNRLGNYLLVRQSDAHAWAEVWLANKGWTRVDPTAAVSPARVQLGAQAAAFADLINRGWNNLIVQFNAQRQQSLFAPIGIDHIDPATLIWLLIGAGGALLGGATLWAMRVSRQHALPLDAAYDALCHKLARIAPPRNASEGPRDYAARIRQSEALAEPIVNEIQTLITRYVGLRYARALASTEAIEDFARSVKRLRLAPRR